LVPYETEVKVWISHYATNDTVRIIFEDTMSAGAQHVFWDNKNELALLVINDVYDCHIQIDEEISILHLVNFMYYYSITGDEVNNYESLSTTDSYGNFNIEFDDLPLSYDDFTFIQYDEEGFVADTLRISNYVKIWALHHDYQPTFVDSLYINDNVPTEVILRFE